jgi:hypothetical protein
MHRSAEPKCAKCGIEKSTWEDPKGFNEEGWQYCCRGCAVDTGCTCSRL